MSRTVVPQQVVRLITAFAVATVVFVVARQAFTPETFGEIGHYRAAAIDSIVAREIKYAGSQQCAICHGPTYERRLQGRHSGLSCEVCHGPAASHAASPIDIKPSAPRDRAFCPVCHSYSAARPTGFPQIDPVAHNPLVPCITCHDPHAPEPPSIPEECSACHGNIARQKAVSRHAALPCTTCHEAPEAHKVSPRSVRPTKPTESSFCGTCHAQGPSEGLPIPQIDLSTHGQGYLCWQCHYAHHPSSGDQ